MSTEEAMKTKSNIKNTWPRLQAQMYKTAREKGWWDTDRPPLEILMLVITEIVELRTEMQYLVDGEALFDAHRAGEELADIVIRLGDAAAHWNIDATPWAKFPRRREDFAPFWHKPFDTFLMNIVTELGHAAEEFRRPEGEDRAELAGHLRSAISHAAIAASFLHVDLVKAVREKMAKNKKRPRRHGGKRY